MTRARGDYVVAGDRPAATPPARCGGIGTAWLNVRGIFRPGVRLPESAHTPLRRPNRSRASRLIQFRQASTGRLSRRDPACREDQGGHLRFHGVTAEDVAAVLQDKPWCQPGRPAARHMGMAQAGQMRHPLSWWLRYASWALGYAVAAAAGFWLVVLVYAAHAGG